MSEALARAWHRAAAALALGLLGAAAWAAGASAPPAGPASAASAAAVATPAVAKAPPALPADIRWETNLEDPPIGSPQALRGGTLRYALPVYPLTFRLVGPNSNDYFAAWNRLFTMNFGLVERHPVTDRFIPMMATAWSVQADQRTIYFKLDRDARFSDGHPITAADYVATWEMMRSPHILDPFYNTYAKQFFESVDRIDDYTLRIVGTRPSWRPLSDYGGLWPTPAHATRLDADWVTRSNNQFQIVPGPYTIAKAERGASITLQRVPHWWGDGKRYFTGRFNFDRIELRVVPDGRELDYLRRGDLDIIVASSAREWAEDYNFPAVTKGWLRRARIGVDKPTGISGMHMNLQAPIFRNVHFRRAMQYLFDFDRLNRNVMFGQYVRMNSFFEGTPYANKSIVPYGFDPAKARQELALAGYHRPAELGHQGWLATLGNVLRGLIFTRADDDDVLVDSHGNKASFTLLYGNKGLERHLTVVQQDFRRAGVEMRLRLLEPGTAFARGLERKYEMVLTNRTAGFYPDPRQYLGSEFAKTTNNNDIWGYSSPEVDKLIEIYERNPDPQARLDAMHRIDQIVHDEAFYIPMWSAPFIRVAYWDYLRFPSNWLPKRTEQLTDYMVYWIDPARQAALAQAMREDRAYPVDPQIDKDPYNAIGPGAARP